MPKYKNQLQIYRRRMGFSQHQVSQILGDISRSKVSRFEDGSSTPTLMTALALEIVYRVPIAFCYPELYREIRGKLRTAEAALVPLKARYQQGVLF